MKDEIVIADALNGQVRIHAACTSELVGQATRLHHCMATSAAALGRCLSVTAIMASDLKYAGEKITTILNGHGPAGTVLVQADGSGNVKGFIANPNVYLTRADGHLDVGQAIGTKGNLTVTRNMGLKEPFTGTSQIQTGEIGDDFAYYFAVSEQTPSVVGVGVLVNPDGSIKAAGGLIYQLMPNASEEAILFCEQVASKQKAVTSLIEESQSLEEMIQNYFPDAKIIGHRDVRWHCGCSHEGFKDSLATLQSKDLQEMIADDKGADITCQYCNTQYHFSTDELVEVLESCHVENR